MNDTQMRNYLDRIDFTEIILGQEVSFIGIPNSFSPLPVAEYIRRVENENNKDFGGGVWREIDLLRKECKERVQSSKYHEFTIRSGIGIGSIGGYRVSAVDVIYNNMVEQVYVLRRLPREIMRLDELGIPEYIKNAIMANNLRGLVIISGGVGEGKTTTAGAIIKARLEKYGGTAWTIEDPAELPLGARHGRGICYQTEVQQGEFAKTCRDTYRRTPSILMIGEVRDAETAYEVINASINGALTICTVHSDSVINSCERLHALATRGLGSFQNLGMSDEIANTMGDGISMIIHQRMNKFSNPRNIEFSMLKVDLGEEEDEYTKGIKATIKSKKFTQLASVVDLQKNKARMDKTDIVKPPAAEPNKAEPNKNAG